MAYTPPTSMTPGQVFTASRWNTMVKDNFDMLASLANTGLLKWDDTNKYLGVGTATPAIELHTYSTAAGSHGMRSETTNASGYSVIDLKTNTRAYQVASGGSGTSAQAGACYIYDVTAAAVRLHVSATGSVLIGKTSGLTGAGDLDVNGAVAIGGSLVHGGSGLAFYGASAQGKQTVTGSRGGNAALNTLLLALANLGLITNSSTA